MLRHVSRSERHDVHRRRVFAAYIRDYQPSAALAALAALLVSLIFAKEPFEVLGQHTWRTSFDNLAYLSSEANAAAARQASHAGRHDIDD